MPTALFSLIAAVVLLAIAAVLVTLGRRRPLGRTTTPAGGAPASRIGPAVQWFWRNNFAADVAALTLGVILLDWAIYQTGWFPALYDTWGALLGHLAFYLFFGVVLAAGDNRSGRVRTSVIYMAIVAVAVVGISHLFKCNEACQLRKEAQAARETQVRIAAQNPTCSYRKEAVHFGTEPVLVNQNASCSSALWFAGHCIYVRQAGSTKRLGPFCDKGTYQELPADVEYAWSADEPFSGFYELRAPRITQLVRFK